MAQAVVACMKRNPNHLIGIDDTHERLGNIVRNASINAGVPANMLVVNPFGAPRPRHANRVVTMFINH